MDTDSSDNKQAEDADRFRQQMERDARNWSSDQHAGTERGADRTADLAASRARAAKAAERQRAKAAAAKPPATPPRRGPFTMGYGGQSNADYIAERASRGAR